MIIGGTPIPKREIITLIMRIIPTERVRTALKIQIDTNIEQRLEDFPKNQLLEVLQSNVDGQATLEEAKANYALTSNPTLYMISVGAWPDRQALVARTVFLANQGFGGAFWLRSDHIIRSVYMVTPVREFQAQIPFLEIPSYMRKRLNTWYRSRLQKNMAKSR